MKYGDAIPGLLVLVMRLAFLAFDHEAQTAPLAVRWATDAIAVLALLWIGITVSGESPTARRWTVGSACLWLAAIYASHQGVHTFAGWK